jgi:2,5-dihydroxypyridine 5,6-dioxygenase
MSVSDDFRLRMWNDVLDLCRLREGENVIVLTGEGSNPFNLDSAMRASLGRGAKTFRIDLPPVPPRGPGGRETFLGVTPLSGQRLATDVLKRADMIIDLMGLLHSPEQTEILAAGTRMLMVVEPPEVLARMMPTPDDKRRVMAADARLRRGGEMRVTSKAGTDLTLKLGDFPTLPEYGYADEAGHWDHWPSGFTSTWPNERTARGRVVIDTGDMLFPFKMYVTSPITLKVEEGHIRSITGGFEAKYLREYIDAFGDPDAYAVSHVGWGLQKKARWTGLGMRDKAASLGMDARAAYGNFLFSTGPNAEAGGRNSSPCHIDIPMFGCSVSLAGEEITRHGDVVAADQRA